MAVGKNGGPRARLALTELESRRTPSSALAAAGPYAVGVEDGETGDVVVYDSDGTELYRVSPYGADFDGGVRVALADVTGDDVPDLVTAPGAGIESLVKVF